MIKNLASIAFIFVTSMVVGQQGSMSPYSIYGFGEEQSTETSVQSAMGGIGVATQEYNRLNFINPAATASVKLATYDLAGKFNHINVNFKGNSKSTNTTSLQYVALGFPVSSRSGFSFGLQPLFSTGYSLVNNKYQEESVFLRRKIEGSGSVNRLFGSFGIYLFQGFSVGLEGSYLFGDLKRSVIEQRTDAILATKSVSKYTLRGGQVKMGVQYKVDLSKKYQLSTGVAVKFLDNVNQKGSDNVYSLQYVENLAENPKDTLFKTEIDKRINAPTSVVVGFGLGLESKWYVGLNSEFKKASEKQDVSKSVDYQNAFRASIGGYYIPKINSISNYWNRVVYRAGIRFEKTGLALRGNAPEGHFTSINDFGINVGLGLPLPKQLSNLNLGFEYGQRGTMDHNLVREDYWNVRLGLSLNSLNWFKKRRID